jgi:hypothetical protein
MKENGQKVLIDFFDQSQVSLLNVNFITLPHDQTW